MTPLDFAALSAATCYLSHALANTDGVGGVFVTLRTVFGKAAACQTCNALWIALAFILVYSIEHPLTWGAAILYTFAGAGAGIVIAAYSGLRHM